MLAQASGQVLQKQSGHLIPSGYADPRPDPPNPISHLSSKLGCAPFFLGMTSPFPGPEEGFVHGRKAAREEESPILRPEGLRIGRGLTPYAITKANWTGVQLANSIKVSTIYTAKTFKFEYLDASIVSDCYSVQVMPIAIGTTISVISPLTCNSHCYSMERLY